MHHFDHFTLKETESGPYEPIPNDMRLPRVVLQSELRSLTPDPGSAPAPAQPLLWSVCIYDVKLKCFQNP